MPDTLTMSDAVALQTVLEAAQKCARVRWLTERGDVLDGVARHLVRDPVDAYFIDDNTDVRDAYLRISSTVEHFLPVRDVIAMVNEGRFYIDYPQKG